MAARIAESVPGLGAIHAGTPGIPVAIAPTVPVYLVSITTIGIPFSLAFVMMKGKCGDVV